VRLNPFTVFQPGSMRMKNPEPQFTHVVKELKALDIAFLDLIEPRIAGSGPNDGVYAAPGSLDYAIEAWGGDKPVLIAGGFTPEKAKEAVDRYAAYQVVVAFGRLFISTPDLPFRIQKGLELNPYDRPTFYSQGPKGYIDYSFSDEFSTFSKI
jgi:NADPH2 dehydrogenase